MQDILGSIEALLTEIIALGPLVMIFTVFTLVGLLVRLGAFRAIRSGLSVAVGFGGIFLIVDYLLKTVAPTASILANRFGGAFTYVDIGWGAFAAFAFGSPVAYVIIGVEIIVNFIMLFTRLTNTLNLNIWDTWESIIAALIITGVTGNWVAGVVFASFLGVVNLLLADWFAEVGFVSNYHGFPGLALYQGTSVIWGMVSYLISKVLDRIPLLDKAKFSPEYLHTRLGVAGEPMFIGGVVGLLVGLTAGLKWGDVLLLVVNLALCLKLLPMMPTIIMEGLVPVTEAATEFLRSHAPGRQLYIGVDPSIAVGNTTVLTVTVLMAPILIVLALILPGAKNVPLADLMSLMYIWVFAAAPNRGDIVRTLVTCTLIAVAGVYLGTMAAPWLNMVAIDSGVQLPPSAAGTNVTSSLSHMWVEMSIAAPFANWVKRVGLFVPSVTGGVVVIGLALLKKRIVSRQTVVTALPLNKTEEVGHPAGTGEA